MVTTEQRMNRRRAKQKKDRNITKRGKQKMEKKENRACFLFMMNRKDKKKVMLKTAFTSAYNGFQCMYINVSPQNQTKESLLFH